MKDSPVPDNRDLTGHTIERRGEGSRTHHVAIFDYEDGSRREFDGREWALTRPAQTQEI